MEIFYGGKCPMQKPRHAMERRSFPVQLRHVWRKRQPTREGRHCLDGPALGGVRSGRARVCRAAAGMPFDDCGDHRIDVTSILQRMRAIVAFAIPVLMVPIADPLMSLIDVIFLGQFSNSLNVAGLSPATLIFNFLFYSFTALTIATVATVADKLRHNEDAAAGLVLSTSLMIGLFAGSLVGLLLQLHCETLLRLTKCEEILLPIATEYLSIRAWAFPAAIATSVLQGSFIAQRDSRTPFWIVVTSIMLSALGDFVLIRSGFGIAAAAWTTLLSQYFSAAALLWKSQGAKSRVKPTWVIPDRAETLQLVSYILRLGVFYVSKTSSYLFLQSAAARLSPLSMAAHQAVWSLWGMCSFTSAPLEQASLAFLPTARPGKDKNELTVALIACGACLGVLCSLISVGVPTLVPQLLTSDTTLYPIMKKIAPPALVAMLCCGFDVTSTGVLLANRDTTYVARAMVLSLLVLVGYLGWQLHFVGSFSITSVWWGLAWFFASRLAQSIPRVVWQMDSASATRK